MSNQSVFKLKNNTRISDILNNVDVDYFFNLTKDGNYLLLNEDMWGKFTEQDVMKLAENNKVMVLHESDLNLFTYNIDKQQMIDWLMS